MEKTFDVMIAGTLLTLRGDEEKQKALAAVLADEVNAILLNDARIGKLEAAFICALNNLEARKALEEENALLRAKLGTAAE